jgi:hypothetical protein
MRKLSSEMMLTKRRNELVTVIETQKDILDALLKKR